MNKTKQKNFKLYFQIENHILIISNIKYNQDFSYFLLYVTLLLGNKCLLQKISKCFNYIFIRSLFIYLIAIVFFTNNIFKHVKTIQ